MTATINLPASATFGQADNACSLSGPTLGCSRGRIRRILAAGARPRALDVRRANDAQSGRRNYICVAALDRFDRSGNDGTGDFRLSRRVVSTAPETERRRVNN